MPGHRLSWKPYAAPPITAIDLRPREIGRDGAAALLAVLRGEEPPTTMRRGRPQLVIRASTTATPRESADAASG